MLPLRATAFGEFEVLEGGSPQESEAATFSVARKSQGSCTRLAHEFCPLSPYKSRPYVSPF